jgi:DNA polymerase-3 subunit epsilon
VIHFARFEETWLRELLGDPFPLELWCTHSMARRLLPGLPRRSLRALAGYFGFPLHLSRRSHGHVEATAFVWSHLIELLSAQGVDDFASLRAWLSESAPRSTKTYPLSRQRRLELPDAPGVYRMLRVSGDVLYVGKATSLKRRVNSYFQKKNRVGERLLEMLSQARDLDVTVTETDIEAALLECDEIKRHAPPYNVAMREDERAAWYCGRDFESVRTAPDHVHTIGPLPSRRSLAMLPALAHALSRKPEELDIRLARAALGIPVAHRLELASLGAGFAAFRRLRLEAEAIDPRRLLRLGSELWRSVDDMLVEVEEAPEDEDDKPWDAARVHSELERTVLLAAGLVRRGRWLCLLSESAVAWRPRPSEQRRLLVFERGVVTERRFLERGEPLPIPPGSDRPWRERQESFDVASYDRLRVLGTELKRIVSQAPGDVALRFGKRAVLHGPRLWRALRYG